MIHKSIDVFGLGQCALDYIGIIEQFPKSDAKCEFHDLVIQGGGPVATALVALQRWGFRCAFCGVLGEDAFGDHILEDLKREQVDVSTVKIRPESSSQFAFSVAEPANGQRTIFWRRPTGSELQPDEIDLSLLRRSGVLLTDGIFPDATIETCKIARKAGSLSLLMPVRSGRE